MLSPKDVLSILDRLSRSTENPDEREALSLAISAVIELVPDLQVSRETHPLLRAKVRSDAPAKVAKPPIIQVRRTPEEAGRVERSRGPWLFDDGEHDQ